ncbi:acyl carrier protein [Pararhodonellum marinum]|uniref:acyl carrier protein n=1 Tax=Pararhodonellum marinum TaxID=2755358 RepID=UPI00188E1BA0|nr:acyl carrier protein [Pararhodonellum marinum]
MNQIANIKKAIGIFKSYGIPLTGKQKSANFYQELRMDRVYVSGLIFELELELERQLEDEKVAAVQTPSELFHYLLSA